MKLIASLGILSAAALLGGASPSAAQQGLAGDMPGGFGRGPSMEHAPMPPPPHAEPRDQLKRIGATDAQIQALTDLDFDMQTKQIDLRAKAEKADLAMHHQMQGATVDEKAVMEAVDALNQARGEMFKLEIATQLKRKQILGEDLLRKFHEMAPSPEMRDRRMSGPGQGRDEVRPPQPQPDGPRPAMNDAPRPRNDGGSR
jgi:Spy/CpxP family protein refolding chaperone